MSLLGKPVLWRGCFPSVFNSIREKSRSFIYRLCDCVVHISPGRFVKKLEHSWKALVHDGVSSSLLEALLLPPSFQFAPSVSSFSLRVWVLPFCPGRRLGEAALGLRRGPLAGPPASNSAAVSSALQDTVSVHRPGFYAERFQRFMCSTVFKKIPCKWLPPDEPPVTPLLREMGGQDTSVRELPKPLLLCPRPVRTAARLSVSHSVCPRGFRVAAFPLALPPCVIEVRGISGKWDWWGKKCRCGTRIHATG